MSDEEEIEFCMILMRSDDPTKFNIFPMPSKHCHCKNSDKKHFSMYGRYNKDRTNMVPSSDEDVKRFTEYCENIKKE